MMRWLNGSRLFFERPDPFIDSEDPLEHQVDLVRKQPGLFFAVADVAFHALGAAVVYDHVVAHRLQPVL
jgi:hypothetical protein